MIRAVGVVLGGAASLFVAGLPLVPNRVTSPAEIVPGAILSQGFGCTTLALEPVDSNCPGGHFHTGIDLAAPAGTPVFAAAGGVASVGWDPSGFGTFVVVRPDPFTGVYYGHLLRAEVNSGDLVETGEAVGAVGASGLATGPHLHFEVRRLGRPVDPLGWLNAAP